MKRKLTFRKFLVSTVFLCLFFSFSTGCRHQEGMEIQDTIGIAVPVPMTGRFTEYGQDLVNAARIAVEEVNARGGIHGRQVLLIVEDDKGDPRDAVTVAHRIVQNRNIIGIMGHLNSGTMLAASPIYAEAGIPVAMPVPTNPQITKQGFDNLFRIPITDDLQGSAAYDFLSDLVGQQALSIVHNRETYGRGIADEFLTALDSNQGKALLFEGVTSGDQDYRPVIGRIRASGTQGIFFGGEYADAARFIRQAREQGIEAPIVMGDGCFNNAIASIAGDAVRNCYVANIAPIDAPDQKAQAFYDAFRARHEKIVAYAPLGYVATTLLIDALEKSPELTRDAVRKTLSDPGYEFESILGAFSFFPNGDSKGRKIFWHQFKDGELVAIPQSK
jgi:branched-chain amino acid transport system substrate-binding protein